MNRFFVSALAMLTAALTLVSCSSGKSDEKEVAVLIPSDITRFVNMAEVMKSKLASKGYKCRIYNAKGNETTQMAQADTAIMRGAKCICISAVNGNTAASIVRLCHNNDVPIFAYNRLVNNCDLDCFVAGDVEKLAKMMFETAHQKKPRGNYYIICGDRFDLNGEKLRKNLDKLIDPFVSMGDINLIYRTYVENWDPKMAAREIRQAINLSGKKPDAVLAGYDGMARAISDELEQLYGSVDGIAITGQDAELESIKYILDDRQTMTAYHPTNEEAETCVSVAISLAEGKAVKGLTSTTFNGTNNVPTINVSSILIDKDNIESLLVNKYKVYKRSEIYD